MWGQIYLTTWWGNDDQYQTFIDRDVIPSPPAPSLSTNILTVGNAGDNIGYHSAFGFGDITPITFEDETFYALIAKISSANIEIQFVGNSKIGGTTNNVELSWDGGSTQCTWNIAYYLGNNTEFRDYLQANLGNEIGFTVTKLD